MPRFIQAIAELLHLERDMGRIAVVIPVYNITTYLEQAIRSAAQQRYANKEIIVVNDGSTAEATAEIQRICMRFSGVTLLHQEHTGPAAARDRGVAHTQAELIVFFDGDDIMCKGALRYLAAALHRNPEAVAAYAKLKYINEAGDITGRRDTETPSGIDVLYDLLERKLPFCNGTVCIRKAALQALAPGNHAMKFGEDWVLWCHLALSGNIIYAGERIVLHYRLHTTNVTASMPDPENYAAMLAAYDTVYDNPAFIAAVGEARLREMKEKCLTRFHITMATICSAQAQMKEAEYYFSKVNMTIDTLALRT